MQINSRLPEVGTSIFAVMSKMAQECGAINLSQGFPDFAVDEKIIRLVYQYMQEGNNQYAPMPGVPALRQSIADVIFNTYQHRVDPRNRHHRYGRRYRGYFCFDRGIDRTG